MNQIDLDAFIENRICLVELFFSDGRVLGLKNGIDHCFNARQPRPVDFVCLPAFARRFSADLCLCIYLLLYGNSWLSNVEYTGMRSHDREVPDFPVKPC